MSKQKEEAEDTRDVFEKALEYAVPVAGAYLGMKAGSRIASGGAKKLRRLSSNRDSAGIEQHYLDRSLGGLYGGAVTASGLAIAQQRNKSKKRK